MSRHHSAISGFTALAPFALAIVLLAPQPALAYSVVPVATPVPAPSGQAPAPTASQPVGTGSNAPVVIRIGTAAVWTVREPQGSITVTERAAVVQSRINQVLLHHPYLMWRDVKILREGNVPTIYWGPFTIMQVDAAHARVNNFSSPDLLAHAWANSMRAAIKTFFAAKHLPDRALYRTPSGNEYAYKRTDRTLSQPTALRNTRYIFSPDDFEWGAGMKEAGQNGFVLFIKKDDNAKPPSEVYIGNAEGTFTAYSWIRPEDTP